MFRMRFVCDKCKSKYSISDEKVRGKILKIRCKKCKSIIEVRDPAAGGARRTDSPQGAERPSWQAGASDLLTGVASYPGAPPGYQATPPPPPPPPQAPQVPQAPSYGIRTVAELDSGVTEHTQVSAPGLLDELRRTAAGLARQPSEEPALCDWYVAIDDEPTGPLTKEQMRGFITNGRVDAESLVWREGYDDWLPLGTSPELKDLIRGPQAFSAVSAPSPRQGYPPQPPPPQAPQPPPAALRGQHVGRLSGPAAAPSQAPPYGGGQGPGYREREQYQPHYGGAPQPASHIPPAPQPASQMPHAPQAPSAPSYGLAPQSSYGQQQSAPSTAAPLRAPPSEIPRPPSSGEFVVPQIPREPPVEPAAPSWPLSDVPPPPPQPSGAAREGPSMAQPIASPEPLIEDEETVREPSPAMSEPVAAASPPISRGPEPMDAAGALFMAEPSDDSAVPALAPMHEINKGRRQLAYIIAGVGAIIIGIIGAIILIQTGGGGEPRAAHASPEQPSRVGVRLGGDPLVLPMGNSPEEDDTSDESETVEVEDENIESVNGTKAGKRIGVGSREKNGERLTEAERRMLEKAKAMGSDGTSPVNRKNGNSAGRGSSKQGQSLNSDQIRSTISQNRTSIQRCYEREMRGSSSAGDLRVVLRITVQPSGVVSSSRVTTSRIRGTALATCMEGASRRWRFPSATASSTFDAPFVLTPGRGR